MQCSVVVVFLDVWFLPTLLNEDVCDVSKVLFKCDERAQ